MAIKEVLLPHLGESVTEASVVGWLVQPGDKVKRYQPLMEVVSDKVTTEVPSDFEGVIKETFVELDTDYPIGTLLMTIEVEGAEEAPVAPVVEEKVEAPVEEAKTVETEATPVEEVKTEEAPKAEEPAKEEVKEDATEETKKDE